MFFISLINPLHQYHFSNLDYFMLLVEPSVWLLSVLIPFLSNTALMCKGRCNGGEHQ